MSMTMVEAINEVVETVMEFPMSGTLRPSQQFPPDATSVYARAEEFISRESMRIQAHGFPENTDLCRRFVPTSDRVTLPANVLRIRGAGPDSHRTLVIREEIVSETTTDPDTGETTTQDVPYRRVYDANRQTFSMGTGEVFLDAVVLLDIEDLPWTLQDVVVGSAKMKFQRRMQGSQLADQQLMMEYMQAEAVVDRNRPKDDAMLFNVRPMLPQQAQPQQQG